MAKTSSFEMSREVEEILRKEFEEKPGLFFKLFSGLSDEEKRAFYSQNVSSAFEKMMTDPDLVSCVIELMRFDLCLSESSRGAFLHRNTLIYRLDKIKRLTGLDVRKFADAHTCRMLMAVYYQCKKTAR